MSEEKQDKRNFFQKYALAIAAGGLLLVGVVLFVLFYHPAPARKPPALSIVNLMPPPPPPVTPPPPTPPDQKMLDQMAVTSDKPISTDERPQDEDDGMKTQEGASDSTFGLKGGGSGRGLFGRGGGGGKYGWWAAGAQDKISEAMRRNSKTRNAYYHLLVKLWLDAAGRVTRVELGDTTGDGDLDSTIKNEVLMGLLLDPPPSDMPMPVNMRIVAKRSS